MSESTISPSKGFLHQPHFLSVGDIEFFKQRCRQHLDRSRIPCYALLDVLDAPVISRIRSLVEQATGEVAWYLNDFYMYTDSESLAEWHMDTELFTFERAVNAWILLDPRSIDGPVSLIGDLNISGQRDYHHVRVRGDEHIFANLCKGTLETRSGQQLAVSSISTPRVEVGDILLFDPGRFHRTSTSVAKHCLVIKFVLGRKRLSDDPVPGELWPEVDLLTKFVRGQPAWPEVLGKIRSGLADDATRSLLVAGFFPERFELYRHKVMDLPPPRGCGGGDDAGDHAGSFLK